MYQYPDYNTVELDGLRYYICGEKAYPSITTVLGNTVALEKKESLDRWFKSVGEEMATTITQSASERGTAVHKMIENMFLGIENNFSECDELHVNTFKSLKFELKKIKPVGLEVALYSDILRVAGRTDCIGFYNDELSIIDFKTTGRTKNDCDIHDYWLQIAFYAIAHNAMYDTNINTGVIIMGNDKGLPQRWVNNDLSKHYEELATRTLQFHNMRNKNEN